MKIEQIYTGCLAEAAYYIESNGEAAIIDPLREVAPYIEKAEENGANIKYVLETHFHADFVSGHIDLANKTNAQIVFGPTAEPNFEALIATDGQELALGDVTIRVLHTPGHTMESSSYLLLDQQRQPKAIFTGDTLFIGDVGRPDLAVKTDLSREDLAGYLYESLRNKIMTLPDETVVYPGHGAGSACGKHLSSETFDTLGHQKMFNYALRADMTKEEFIKEVTEGLVEPPQYFPKNAVLNKMGYQAIDEVLRKGIVDLDVDQFMDVVDRNEAIILDTRRKEKLVKGYIPGSVWIGIEDNFAPWVGALITDLNQPIVFLADEGTEEEVVTRLSRVGYDNTLGYLKGGIRSWTESGRDVAFIDEISAEDFSKIYNDNPPFTLDVRKESEYQAQHFIGATNFPLDFINRNMHKLNKSHPYYLHCQGGYRSLITATILKARGFQKLVNIQGGFDAIKEAGMPVSQYQEPTTML